MNYKIGDKVYRKKDKINTQYCKKYIFLGITEDQDLRTVRIIYETVGDKVEIGVFRDEPMKVKTTDDSNFYIETFLYNVDLFEKEEVK